MKGWLYLGIWGLTDYIVYELFLKELCENVFYENEQLFKEKWRYVNREIWTRGEGKEFLECR
jgi:hypothetical protein